MVTRNLIGAPVTRAEGPDKVSGHAQYAADVQLPGMLWAKVLRSPYPHARIISIDASKARQAPGVVGVVTGPEHPGLLVGRQFRDMPVLCWDRVRYIGDRVAAVAAETKEAAEAALQLIEVEYEPLPAVFDPLEAMEPDAPLLHDDITAYDGGQQANLVTDVRNGLTRVTFKKGDVEAGFQAADFVLEHTFRLPAHHAGYLEPHSSVVDIQPDGKVHIWCSTKSPFRTRNEIAKAVNIAQEHVRLNPVFVGGDFGGKGDSGDATIAYLLAKQTGRPVKAVKTFTEELTAASPSHPSVVTIRSGVTRDGRVVARTVRALHATGAYGAYKPSPNVAITGVSHGAGPYKVDNTFFETLQVYTNHVPGGFYRAPGAPQTVFAVECHTDLIAQELGMDPAEFRRRNILEEGDANGIGHHLIGVRAKETLEAALDAAEWSGLKPGPNYGRGVAMYERHTPGGVSGATLTATSDGKVSMLSPTFDQGVGTHTVLKQIIAQEFQLPPGSVEVVVGNTDTAPYDPGVGGSRVTNTAGAATLEAAALLKAELTKRAASLLECPEDMVALTAGAFWVREDPRQQVGVGAIVTRSNNGQPIRVTSEVNVKTRDDITCFVAQVAEVEVDPETGQVKLLRFTSAHDSGTVINPITHQGQIDGGLVQGLGIAMMEDLAIEDGQVTTPHLGEYKLPSIADIPASVQTRLLDQPDGPLPYGGKAIGEMANVSPPPAVANAIADAVGVRLFDLPLTAEKVYRALQERNGGR